MKRTSFTSGNCLAVFSICDHKRLILHEPPDVLFCGSENSSVKTPFLKLAPFNISPCNGNSVLKPFDFSSFVKLPSNKKFIESCIGVLEIEIFLETGRTASGLHDLSGSDLIL